MGANFRRDCPERVTESLLAHPVSCYAGKAKTGNLRAGDTMLVGRPSEIIPQVYQLPLFGTSALLLAEETLTVIDGGWRGNGSRIMIHLRRLGRSPEEISYIIPTHGHPDHIGGIAHLRENSPGRVAAHEAEPAGMPATDRAPAKAGRLGSLEPLLARLFAPLLSPFKPPPFPVDIPLQDGSRLSPLGGMEVVHTPGHTADSISLHFPSRGLLMVGDALQCRGGRLDLPSRWFSSDLNQARESVRRLAQLDFEVLCFSHFPPIKKSASRFLRQFADSLD